MNREDYLELWDQGSRLMTVQLISEDFRAEWSSAAYAVTMPGNIDAFVFALTGGH